MNTRMRTGGQANEGQLLPGEPRWLSERSFRQGDVPAVRRFTRAFGLRAGVASGRLSDFVLAASEASACVTARGPCTARIRLWTGGQRAFCEARGDGLLIRRTSSFDQPAGQRDEEEALRRLVLQQVADYVSVAGSPEGIRVLLSMTVA
jgi:hypothetical protein